MQSSGKALGHAIHPDVVVMVDPDADLDAPSSLSRGDTPSAQFDASRQ